MDSTRTIWTTPQGWNNVDPGSLAEFGPVTVRTPCKIWTLSQRWNNVDTGTYFTCKIWTIGICRGVSEVSGNYCSGPSAHNVLQSRYRPHARLSFRIYCTKFVTNARFERSVGPLRHIHEKQSFLSQDTQLWTPLTSLVVTDFFSCDLPIVGTNFSEWVQIFPKNSFRGNRSPN